ncbi:MAG: methylmalonyl-CoA mutase family protein [Deltaproteobacteria bacterium]|nr:methylmalonyl-CoA mutase family protein [Deltaproteobacteria bacterium]MBW2121153.1 methylmalonyl-CoA mutase family protein [Deltaproteobacteria bacterium]
MSKDDLTRIRQGRRLRKRDLEEAESKVPPRSHRFSTVSDLEIEALYTPEDVKDLDYSRDLGFPGRYPFTRGIHPSMYRGRLWTMRMFSGLGGPEETNRRFKYLLEQGETGLSVAFHFPTLMGYDSDSPMARGEVGKCGVAVDTLRDMEILLDGIALDRVTTSMTINPPASILLAMYIVVAEKQGVDRRQISGTIQNDMLKEFIAQKTLMLPPGPSIRLIVDTVEFCTREVPCWNTISVSGYHIREAGATAVQELAFTLADGIAYVEACIERGLGVDDFAPRLSFFFDSHIDFFEEISKLRAARRMWAKIMKDRFGARNPRSWMLRFHTQTAGVSLTAQQPYNNVVRTTVEAMAAVLGGTQSLHTNALDETYAIPTEEAAFIALRTQQILAEETGIANTIDPLAGSYFVEALTNRIEHDAWQYIGKIDKMGGMVRAIERGYPQAEIAESAYRYQQQIDRGEKTLIGVNRYVTEHPPIHTWHMDPAIEKRQLERLRAVKEARDAALVEACLRKIRDAALTKENLMPYIIDAVRAYATVQEICDVFREVFGTYRDPGMF